MFFNENWWFFIWMDNFAPVKTKKKINTVDIFSFFYKFGKSHIIEWKNNSSFLILQNSETT